MCFFVLGIERSCVSVAVLCFRIFFEFEDSDLASTKALDQSKVDGLVHGLLCGGASYPRQNCSDPFPGSPGCSGCLVHDLVTSLTLS